MSRKTEFQSLPEQDDLAQFERELRFFPSTVKHPQVLSRNDAVRFNRDGYLTGLCIFNAEEIAGHRRYFDRLLEQVTAAGGDSYSISTAHLKYGRVYDLLVHRRIVACVRDLLGENVIAWGSHYFCKMPGDGKAVAWHQDAGYWPLSPSKSVTVWLAIDDADLGNGCMRLIPGSHLYGEIEWQPSDTGEGNVLNQTVEEAEQYGRPPVAIELAAGEISIHADLLLHGSEANDSDRRRCGLTLRYCTPDVRAGMDWNRKGVIVSGSDPSNHWANPPRPGCD